MRCEFAANSLETFWVSKVSAFFSVLCHVCNSVKEFHPGYQVPAPIYQWGLAWIARRNSWMDHRVTNGVVTNGVARAQRTKRDEK
eukprot:3965166-Amphidinium_carterae.2